MKRKGFTLVELLVVIAIIALLMGILMPALAKVRQIAYRMVCGTNLGGIGKGFMMYANDYDEEYPRSGSRLGYWDPDAQIDWDAPTMGDAIPGRVGTITSSFFLLVRYTDAPVEQFVCNGDLGAEPLEKQNYPSVSASFEITDGWDFGETVGTMIMPSLCCSYSYHLPFDTQGGEPGNPITPSSNPASPLCADRNPFFDRNADDYLCGALANEEPAEFTDSDGDGADNYYDPDKTENSASHQRDGQNVLFNDGRVEFCLTPNVGIEQDNIWKFWTVEQDPDPEETQFGTPCPGYTGSTSEFPVDEEDAWLVNERNDNN